MELLDYLLMAGLAADERSARGLLLAGRVLVDNREQRSAHLAIREGQNVRLRERPGGRSEGAVSRGVDKLAPVLASCGMQVEGRVCLDLGVSTGGFTQVLLQQGAPRVYCVDVGYGIMAEPLRSDPRIVLLERTNARLLSTAQVPEPVERVVGDLSFISWRAVLPAVVPLLAKAGELLLLVKPQFELAASGRGEELSGGVSSRPGQAAQVLQGLYNVWVDNGLEPLRVMPSALRGSSGNQEYFAYLRRIAGLTSTTQQDYALLVAAALAAAGELA